MTDKDIMPWGVYKGQPIGNVDFDYLLRLYKKEWLSGDILIYFEKQLKELEASENRVCGLSLKKPKKYLIESYECKFPKKI